LVCNKQVNYEYIYTEGITKITTEDFAYAKEMGRSIKLLASSKKADDKYACMVAPFMLDKDHPLCNVNGVFNSVFVHGNMLGDAMFYGSGAGKLPTASAVVADIVDMAKHNGTNIFIEWSQDKMQLVDYKENVNRFFVRTATAKDEVEAVFGEVEYVEGVVEGEIVGCVVNVAHTDSQYVTYKVHSLKGQEPIFYFKDVNDCKIIKD
jgi:homoserine dehydrogenase